MIKGRVIAKSLRSQLKTKVKHLKRTPCLATILIGNNPASALYIRMKNRACKAVGIKTVGYKLKNNCSAKKLHRVITNLNNDSKVDGILIEKPYQIKGATETEVDDWIDPDKDVDGTNAINVTKIVRGDKNAVYPCTPQAIINLINHNRATDNLSGLQIAIINRSEIVGKPLAMMLINAGAEVTVFNHNMRVSPLRDGHYDIVIAATGQPGLITSRMVHNNEWLIPVSEVRGKDGKLHGDFSEGANKKAMSFACTGNVGPLTIYALLHNIYRLSLRHIK